MPRPTQVVVSPHVVVPGVERQHALIELLRRGCSDPHRARSRGRLRHRRPTGVWADVTWSYGGGPRERFRYQLVDGPDGYRSPS